MPVVCTDGFLLLLSLLLLLLIQTLVVSFRANCQTIELNLRMKFIPGEPSLSKLPAD